MQEYYKDKTIKFEHTPVIDKEINSLNEIGATGSLSTASGYYEIDYTPTDLNTIYVSATDGDDDTGDGSESDPVATLAKADELCDTNDIHNVIIQDSEEYTLESFTFTADGMTKLYAAKGETPVIIPSIVELDVVDRLSANSVVLNNANYTSAVRPFTSDEVLACHGLTNSLYIQRIGTDKTVNGYGLVAIGASSFFHGNCAVLSNKYVTAFYYVGSTTYALVLKSDLTQDVAGTSILAGSVPINAIPLSNDNAVVFTHNSPIIYMSIVNGRTLEAVTETAVTIISDASVCGGPDYIWCSCVQGDDTNIYVGVTDKVKVYTQAGVYIDTYSLTAGNVISAELLYNGNILFGIYDSSNQFKIIIWDPITQTELYVSGVIDSEATYGLNFMGLDPYSRSTRMPDGNVVIGYTKRAASNANYAIRYWVFAPDGTALYTMTPTITNHVSVGVQAFENNTLFALYENITDTKQYGFIDQYTQLSINAETDIELHGLTLSMDIDKYIPSFITLCTSNLLMRWCTFDGMESPYLGQISKAIIGVGNVDMENILMTNVDSGIDITGDLTAKWCQFISIKKDYALQLTDSTEDTEIDHCDFISCYGGISLATNSGDEVIKNSIFYRNSLTSIDADVEINYDNCINTGTTANVVPGTNVFNINPMYINDGTLNPLLRNLNLRNRILGYAVDSPALYLGDDDLNAGSLDIEYIGDETLWTAITVDKDKQGIKVEYLPVGEVKTERKDGSISTYKDALSEVVTIEWKAISNSDFTKIYNMVKSSSSRVKIYFQPTTDPLVYDEYILIYDKLNASPGTSVALSRTGKTNVELVFQRAAE